jgi:hypothetical protein
LPCPQCKRRAGYTLIEDTSRCAEIYELAFTLIQADQLATSSIVQLNMQKIIDQNWWVAAAEGSLSAGEIEGLAAICAEMKIDRLIGLLPQENHEAHSNTSASGGNFSGNTFSASPDAPTDPSVFEPRAALGLAFVETNEDALRNFSWDFPLSFLLFPPSLEFLLSQYSHPAILVAGPKLLAERVFNKSIEESIEQFKEDMEDSQGATLAAFLIESIIEPANSSAAK